MKILPIYQYKTDNKNMHSNKLHNNVSIPFTHSENNYSLEEMLGYNNYIENLVKNSITPRKDNIVSEGKKEAIENLQNSVQNNINNYQKMNNIDNKNELLDKLADSYVRKSDFEKAAAITIQSMNMIFNDKTLTDQQKKDKILAPKKLNVIREYWKKLPFEDYRINRREHNTQFMYYTIKTINDIGYKEFLPFAENICEASFEDVCRDISLSDYRLINNEARLLINKHHNLNTLGSCSSIDSKAGQLINKHFNSNEYKLLYNKNKEKYYNRGMIEVLSKWGLPEHVKLLYPFLEKDKWLKECVIVALGNIGDKNSISLLEKYARIKSSIFSWNEDLNSAAINSLSQIDSPKAKNILLNLFNELQAGLLNPLEIKYQDICKALVIDGDEQNLKLLIDNVPDVVALGDVKTFVRSPEVIKFILSYMQNNPEHMYSFELEKLAYQDINEDIVKKVEEFLNKYHPFRPQNEYDEDDNAKCVRKLRACSKNIENKAYDKNYKLVKKSTWD